MELWDVYDENRVKTGRLMTRGEEIKEGDYHLVVHVCIFNDNDELLIQQRQSDKKSNPNMWDVSVAGSSIAGEDSRMAAMRETKEELGYDIDLRDERPFFTIHFDRGFDDFYLIDRNIDIDDLKLQKEEVKDIKWASREEIKDMVARGEFIQYYFLDILFDMRKQRGSYKLKWGV